MFSNGSLITVLCGKKEYRDLQETVNPSLISSPGGCLTLLFHSDYSNPKRHTGFRGLYSVQGERLTRRGKCTSLMLWSLPMSVVVFLQESSACCRQPFALKGGCIFRLHSQCLQSVAKAKAEMEAVSLLFTWQSYFWGWDFLVYGVEKLKKIENWKLKKLKKLKKNWKKSEEAAVMVSSKLTAENLIAFQQNL